MSVKPGPLVYFGERTQLQELENKVLWKICGSMKNETGMREEFSIVTVRRHVGSGRVDKTGAFA